MHIKMSANNLKASKVLLSVYPPLAAYFFMLGEMQPSGLSRTLYFISSTLFLFAALIQLPAIVRQRGHRAEDH
jgi:hypothetical protein